MRVISPEEGIRNLLILCGVFLVVLVWRHIHEEDTIRRHLSRRLEKFQFCGFSLSYLVAKSLPDNLERFLNLELSEYFAILMMFALRNNHTARIVKASFNEDGVDCWHFWVEFRFLGTWYAVDPVWYEDYVLLRPMLGFGVQSRPEEVYSAKDFWSLPITNYFYQQSQSEDTSYFLYELLLAVDDGRLVDISGQLNESSGRAFIPIWFKDQQVINQRIFSLLAMSGPRYCQPSEALILAAMREETLYRTQHSRA